MNKKELLNRCLTEVELKYNTLERTFWTHKDYVQLSEQISGASKLYISASSLKRLFGKVSYQYFPQIQTRNALCIYTGYANWDEFVAKQDSKTMGANIIRKPIFTVGAILLVVAVFITAFLFLKSEASFIAVKTVGNAPLNVSFKYKLPLFGKNQYYINFDDLNRIESHQLSPDEQTINHTFINSDVYHVKLFKGNKLIQSIPVVSMNNEWETLICDWNLKENFCKNIYNTEKIIDDGVLQVNPEIVRKYGFDTTNNYWVKHRYFTEIGVSDTAFVFESRFRNVSLRNLYDCPAVNITVVGLHHNLKIHFSSSGCISADDAIFEFSDKMLDSHVHDMSMFEVDLEEWRDLKVMVKNKTVFIYMDGDLLYEINYSESLGKLYGTILDAKDIGEFDYIRYTDLKGNIYFEDRFE